MVTQRDEIDTVEGTREGESVTLLCWRCGAPSIEMTPETRAGSGERVCLGCMAVTKYKEGIWQALSPQQIERFQRFVAEYEFIRSAEGRGSDKSDYYLSLPYKDISGRNSDQWKIRACTFGSIVKHIVSPLAKARRRSLRILDLGAGNGWMSYRLSLMGHQPIAVDLLSNDQDGLGAAIHFSSQVEPLFPRVQAELDQLPFPSPIFDLVIFNASFHYSQDYQRTLAEALRCTRSGGGVVIADTPWYAREESGIRMVEEKHKHFASTYGFSSNSISSQEYITPERLNQLQETFKLEWRMIKPFYGIQWSLRPVRAKLEGRRPPSEFRIYTTWAGQ